MSEFAGGAASAAALSPRISSAQEESLLWTLEEISHLVSHSGNAAETLTNIVTLIQRRFTTDVCSVYLLEADRSTLVLAATVGLRAESVGRIRMRLTEGLAGLVAQQLKPLFVEDAIQHPRFKYFKEAGEDAYHTFLGVPLIDRGLLQGVLVVQTREARVFAQDVVRMLVTAGAQLAPIVSEARTLRQFVAPAHQRLSTLAHNLWWSWDEATVSLFREIDPIVWREVDHNPVALLRRIPIETLEERASQLVLHSRINHAYRRLQEYLQSTHTWGARHAGVLWARPVAYFSAEFGFHESIPIYSGGLGILAGDHVKAASDLGIPLGPRAFVDLDIDTTRRTVGEEGRLLRCTATTYDPHLQRADVRLLYDRFDQRALAERLVTDFASHVYFPAELELLFLMAGFEVVQQYGDYRFVPVDRTTSYVVTAARRPSVCPAGRTPAGRD